MSQPPPIDRPYRRLERTGWRDEALSERHGHWGFNCPALDIDFVMIEYDRGIPKALVEYKHRRALGRTNYRHPSYRALHALARGSGIPLLIAFYDPGCWAFKVYPVNFAASRFFPRRQKDAWISETEFVTQLYAIRKIPMPAALLSQLNNTLPSN